MKWVFLALLGAAILLAAWGGGQWRWAAKTQALLERLDAARVPAPTEHFEPRDLARLPLPVANHLRRALPETGNVVRAVEIRHRGTFNLSETGERWRPFTSRQRVVTRRPGFVWDGRVSMVPGLAVHVHDAYVAGEGILEPALMGLFTLMQLRDREEVARGELMRFLAETVWYPTAWLAGQGVHWDPIDERSARAVLTDAGLTVSLDFHFGADGLLEVVRADARGRSSGGKIIPTPWEARVANYYPHRDGFLVPLEGEVAWLTPQGRVPYWRGTITAITYHR